MPKNLFYHYKPDINIWLVIMSGLTFFIVLSWYNFGLDLFNFLTSADENDPAESTLDLRNTSLGTLKNKMFNTLTFALIYTAIVLIIYMIFNYYELLHSPNNNNEFHESRSSDDTSLIKTDEIRI